MFCQSGFVWRREFGDTSYVPNGHQAWPAVFPALYMVKALWLEGAICQQGTRAHAIWAGPSRSSHDPIMGGRGSQCWGPQSDILGNATNFVSHLWHEHEI